MKARSLPELSRMADMLKLHSGGPQRSWAWLAESSSSVARGGPLSAQHLHPSPSTQCGLSAPNCFLRLRDADAAMSPPPSDIAC